MAASINRIGIPFRIGYSTLHVVHVSDSALAVNLSRHLGQTTISRISRIFGSTVTAESPPKPGREYDTLSHHYWLPH